MPDFKTVPLKPLTGIFDTLSSPDEIGFGNWHVVKNATTRSTRNRQRGGGWRRLFADDFPYNNQDLHDQLTDQLGYFESFDAVAAGGGGLAGYGYPYFAPAYVIDGETVFPPASGPYFPVYIGDFPDGMYNGCPIFYPYVGTPYAFNSNPGAEGSGVTSGAPNYYLQSYLYTSCPLIYEDISVDGYPYGNMFGIYDSIFSYGYTYCGSYMFRLQGCREAITMLQEVVTASGRKLIAATMSRLYELNQSAGNWRILADGLGNSGYTSNQCGCNQVRGVSDTLGSYLLYTNNFDPPLIYLLGDESSGCELQAAHPVTDLVALGVTKAGGVVTWKGFSIFFDFTEDGVRMGGSVIWSDLEDPNSYIEGDTSFAGRSTIAVGETILAAAELGNWLIFYTDKSIIRTSLVGGEDVFNFERVYTGGNALKYKYSLINCGDQHIYLGESDVYIFTQFDTRPINLSWITKAAGMIFNGIAESEATYLPINKEACDLVTGGWSDEKREAWISWPTGENLCPDVTLRFNLKFNTADFVDHGFTAMMTFRADDRPTVGQWIEDMGICPRGSQVATGIKDGPVAGTSASIAVDPGSSLVFDGVNDVVVVPNSASLGMTTALTIEAWVKASDTSLGGIFEKTIGGVLNTSYMLMLYGDKILFRLVKSGGLIDIFSATSVPANVWTHIVATWDGVVQRLYINGVLEAYANPAVGPIDTGAGTSSFGSLAGVAYPLEGQLDEVRIWNIARTEAEIVAWKDRTLVGNESGLAAYWRLDEGAGILASDSSGNGNTGTLTDGPTWQTSDAFATMVVNTACLQNEEVNNPPLYIRNPTEDPDLPVHPDSLCNRLANLTMEDFCIDCASQATFITASATDFTLKQQEDDVYYRQMLGGRLGDYDVYVCSGEFYNNEGYVTAMQTGAQDFRTDDEKIVKMLGVEAEPVPQSTPLALQMEVGYGSQPSCMDWRPIRSLPFECLTDKTPAQHRADRTRPDGTFYYPTFRRGVYLGARFRINGIGGAGKFSSLFQSIKGWGQQDSP